jgi:sugar/nucleoside kinase (ribokinase family)
VSDFEYVTVGHVTVDVLEPDGLRRPGGGAFYSALQAARLGLRTLIVTKGAQRELEGLLAPYREELDVEILPAEQTTTLATWGMGAQRRQQVLAWAGAMSEPIEVDTSILHLAAVARETPGSWRGRADFVGITPQGWTRAWDERGEISHVALDPEALPEHVDALAISEVERAWCEELIASPAKRAGHMEPLAQAGDRSPAGGARVMAVTAGSAPTTIVLADGSETKIAVPARVRPREDLGAGDVFAAAFFVALHEGRSPADAAAYGNAAATVRIAGEGTGAIGDRAAIAAAPRQ